MSALTPVPAGRPRIGVNLPTWPLADGRYATWPEMRTLARDAEAVGIDTLWVPDHLQRRLPDRPTIGFWECWTILTAVTEATATVEVGTFVANTAFRNPGLLARMAATLDEVSGGRLVLGLGSGVPATDETWAAFGYDADRHVSRHAEAVEAIVRLLREGRLTYAGEFVHLAGAEIVPAGPTPGGPPIWIAAKGERTMTLAARFGDAVNVNEALTGPEDATAAVARVAAACATVGRDPATLPVTGWARVAMRSDGSGVLRPGWLGGRPDEVAAAIRAIGAAGIAHVTFYVGADDDPSPLPALTRATLDLLAPVLEALRAG
jgi:alkanesulfonate monooxygenase SsuD/methylene tetrahydromethanopterin reductase-like flavin-dependent oxidoreductase (luciferase family)